MTTLVAEKSRAAADQAATGETRTAGRDVVAPLTYIVPQDEKPVFQSQAYTGGDAKFFFEVEQRETPIKDLRRSGKTFSLDREGFSFVRSPTKLADLYDDAAVDTAYRAEIERLVRAEVGATDVVVFDVTRRSDGGAGASNRDGARGVASRIHVDYTAKSGPQRARDALGAEVVDRLLAEGRRIVQVNVWRPIKGPVQRSPLALADASTVKPADLIATDQVFPNRVGEIYHLAYDAGQQWWYAPEMAADETLLIKGWDSAGDGRAQFTPHTAFALPNQDDAAPRESIEVRAYAVI